MPIFEFKCSQCQKNFEEIVTADTKVMPCPACGYAKAKKQLSCTARAKAFGSKSACSGCVGGNYNGCAGGNYSGCGQ